MSPQTFKHFRILQLLGKGGMGEVYLALDTTLERKVALKFLPRDLLRDPSAQGRLLDEARSVSRVQHPNIAVIHSIEEDGGIFALCMEYVDGVTLKQLVARGPLSLNQIVRIGADIASGMHAAHEQGIVHRDLKPANVMISRRGEVKVMDFGLAVRPQRVVNTLGPNTYGTVQYMSPEQAQGQKLGPASDIFSFGSLLYELVTGRAPFNAANDLAILQSIINTQPEPLREHRRDVPPALEQIVRGCMAKLPDQRWASMQDIRDELQYVEPTVEAGPRDLISELSSGLAERKGQPSHRPDNAGRVGRRSVGRAVTPSFDPVPTESAPIEVPEGFIVHEVRERGSDVSRPVVPQRTAEISAVVRSAPRGMVFGNELPSDALASKDLVLQSTSEQWQDRAREKGSGRAGSREALQAQVAREAARRARNSRPVVPLRSGDLSGSRRAHLQDYSGSRAPLRRPGRGNPLSSAVLPALVALLVVAAAGYFLLYRVGAAPPPREAVRPVVDRVFGAEPASPPTNDRSTLEKPQNAESTSGSSLIPLPLRSMFTPGVSAPPDTTRGATARTDSTR